MNISHETMGKKTFQALRTEVSKDLDEKKYALHDGNNK